MVKPLLQSAAAGLERASDHFDRSAAQVTRLAGALSAAETAATVQISPEAREVAKNEDNTSNATLEGAIVDTRIAKYQFIANLRVVQTGDEMARDLNRLGAK